MQVGIVGVGSIFPMHAEAYRAIGVPIACVADVDRARAEREAARFGVARAVADWAELLKRNDVSIIDVCTPPATHRDIVLAALAAGKHVVCEKPLAQNLAEADEIVEAADAASGRLTVVHQARCRDDYRRLKWLVDNKWLGRVCMAHQVRFDAPPPMLVAKGAWGGWQYAGGGVVMTKAIHQLDQLLWLLGDAQRVQAMMGTYLHPIESEDHASISIQFKNGALASVCISGDDSLGYREELDLVGDQGSASLRHVQLRDASAQARLHMELDTHFPDAPSRGAVVRRKLARVGARLGLMAPVPARLSEHAKLLRQFVDAVKGHAPIPVTVHEARQAVELCTAVYTAALTGEAVELPLGPSARFYGGIRTDDYACKV
jgi:UDP-N-acetyl-2-amino-2-deoxyglucuronate dehydrogenase